ncbi:AAA family ATPase [Sphingomonas lenta]|uniref:AAA family ATPase n=1 Tax=Sphingomonas lenta TaxID=1141887 RepID=A0A2A2SES5_9SPHN|nr:AAA family ATPase [Sphingomonas lenta]PAX07713.1 AAA family ATPase [Sphingomonas lenta]
MTEHDIVRGLVLRIGRGVPASAPLAAAVLEWAEPHLDWLLAGSALDGDGDGDGAAKWDRLLARLAQAAAPDEARPHALQLADALAELLTLEPFDAALLALMVACDRLPRVGAVARSAGRHGRDLPALLGELAGAEPHDAERAVRRSAVLRLGLVGFVVNRQGEVEVDVRWALERLLDRAPGSGPEMIDALVGRRQTAALALDDFAHVVDADLLVRLLRGAVAERAPGVNILIHGPPGTGKTEFARALAQAAGVVLHAVGEADEDDEEPDRWQRVAALGLAQRLLGQAGEAVLLFDEMEDLIGEARPSGGDWFAKREGSKVFVNRLLEANPAPVIWTTNAIGNIDGAILRRMSFVLKLDLPSPGAARRMLARVAADEGVVADPAVERLIDAAPEAATVLRVAARAARLAGEDGSERPARVLVEALRGGELPPGGADAPDLDLFECDTPLDALFDRIAAGGALDVSLLLTGPPGTGKTALGHHLARRLDRPLLVRRASDLLSKWVGETEARRRGGVLLLDEADSLLFDRTTARSRWEVGQVNELLTWLDRHPLPVVAATNHPGRLDPATLRRFVFKLDLRPLGRDRAVRAFERFFGRAAPASLAEVGGLTPGDFAVVARQLRHAPAESGEEIAARLDAEVRARPEAAAPMGF